MKRRKACANTGDCAFYGYPLMRDVFSTSKIVFEVHEDEVAGGFVAIALGYAIATQGDTLEELWEMVRDAVHCHFGDEVPDRTPKIIRLYFVRDEAMAV
jgi:predicted RNase H-like HicB family nuclease